MKKQACEIIVSDHALIRFLERHHGIDFDPLRRDLTAKVKTAAELGATSLVLENLRFVLSQMPIGEASARVAIKTVLPTRTKAKGRGRYEK